MRSSVFHLGTYLRTQRRGAKGWEELLEWKRGGEREQRDTVSEARSWSGAGCRPGSEAGWQGHCDTA